MSPNLAFSSPVAVPLNRTAIANKTISPARRAPRFKSRRASPICALPDLRDERTKEAAAKAAQLQAIEDPFPGPYANFAEQVNGRAAMVGFFIALVVEATSGLTINRQIELIGVAGAKQLFLALAPFIELFSRSLLHLS